MAFWYVLVPLRVQIWCSVTVENCWLHYIHTYIYHAHNGRVQRPESDVQAVITLQRDSTC